MCVSTIILGHLVMLSYDLCTFIKVDIGVLLFYYTRRDHESSGYRKLAKKSWILSLSKLSFSIDMLLSNNKFKMFY